MTDVIANFDRSAVAYEAMARPQFEMAAALAQLIGPAERHGRAVEFGAGPGLFTEHVQPWDGPYLATDAAAAMVRRGRVRCPQVEWAQHDARTVWKGPAADWIFSCNLLQWLDEPEKVLRLWRGQTHPGGHMLVAVLVHGTLGELAEVLPTAAPVVTGTVLEWQTQLTRAGFALEKSQSWHYVSVYPTALNFLRAMHAMGFAPRRGTGPGRLRAALRDYDRRFAVAGGVQATWQAWLARAQAV